MKIDLREANCKGFKTHGLSKHHLYYVWRGIISRCYNEKVEPYKNYGGKGVVMCDKWRLDFKLFFDWCVLNGWEKGLEIDKDIKGNGLLYSPETCCIVTRKDNANKRKSNVVVEYDGVKYNLKAFATKFNFNYKLLAERMKRYGWSFERAISTPIMQNKWSFKKVA